MSLRRPVEVAVETTARWKVLPRARNHGAKVRTGRTLRERVVLVASAKVLSMRCDIHTRGISDRQENKKMAARLRGRPARELLSMIMAMDFANKMQRSPWTYFLQLYTKRQEAHYCWRQWRPACIRAPLH